MCTWEKSVFCFWGWNVLKTTIRCIRTDVWFKGCASLLILFQDDLSIGVNGVLQSPTIIVLKSISFLMVIAISLCIDIEVFLCWVYKYLYCYISFLDWSLDHYVVSFLSCSNNFYFKVCLSDINIAISSFFWFPFAWDIFLHSLTFSLYVSLGLKWVSCRQHIYGSCFCIHSATLCLLLGTFNPFTLKVIIDVYVPIAIFLII